MEQKEDVGTKDVEPLTPCDWKERLLELAAGLDETSTPAGRRVAQAIRLAIGDSAEPPPPRRTPSSGVVVVLEAPALVALAEVMDGLLRRSSQRYKALRGIDRAMCEHIMSDGVALQEIGALIDGAKKGGYL